MDARIVHSVQITMSSGEAESLAQSLGTYSNAGMGTAGEQNIIQEFLTVNDDAQHQISDLHIGNLKGKLKA